MRRKKNNQWQIHDISSRVPTASTLLVMALIAWNRLLLSTHEKYRMKLDMIQNGKVWNYGVHLDCRFNVKSRILTIGKLVLTFEFAKLSNGILLRISYDSIQYQFVLWVLRYAEENIIKGNNYQEEKLPNWSNSMQASSELCRIL